MVTSSQKKTYAPILIFVLSFGCYVATLGSAWSLLFSIPFGTSAVYLCFLIGLHIGPKITAWFSRDGWK